MSLETEIKAGGLDRGRFRYFPVVPGRLEFTVELRKLLLAERPAAVAVELPGFLAAYYQRAVARLPQMSVILYHDEASEDDRAIFVPVEPCDAFVEALRTAEEIGAQVIFLEPDSADRPHLPDTYPDTYAVRRIGFDATSRRIAFGRRCAPRKWRRMPRLWRGSCKAPIPTRARWWWCR